MTQTILQIDTSARVQGSTSRQLSTRIAAKLGGKITRRDLNAGVPQIDETWIAANFTPADQRTEAQTAALALSDSLIAEIMEADVLVIGVPVYNFGVPAALKAWIDQIARTGVTFKYAETGPKGLLSGKRAILAVASGGTKSRLGDRLRHRLHAPHSRLHRHHRCRDHRRRRPDGRCRRGPRQGQRRDRRARCLTGAPGQASAPAPFFWRHRVACGPIGRRRFRSPP